MSKYLRTAVLMMREFGYVVVGYPPLSEDILEPGDKLNRFMTESLYESGYVLEVIAPTVRADWDSMFALAFTKFPNAKNPPHVRGSRYYRCRLVSLQSPAPDGRPDIGAQG